VKRTEEKSVFPEDTAQIAKMLAHPDWLVSRWAREHGIETARRICEFDQQVPPTAFRLFDTTAETELQKSEISTEPGRLLSTAKRLVSGDLEKPGLLRDGRIAIQDEASQLVALLVGGGSRMLDCCAAPGGKTRILAAQNPHATVVSVELHSHRARLLRKLVQQPNVQIIAADVTQLPFSTSFDKILVDVPCSGTGTLARNPEIKWRLTENDLVDLRSWQLAILRSAMHQLAIRGRLIYSTCSLEKEENEQVIEEAMSGNSGFQIIACETELRRLSESGELIWPEPKSLCRGPYLRTIPGIHPCDGFFAAILERRSN
jgi:16S rRNA (cytosine967-C5)-methyltransferase